MGFLDKAKNLGAKTVEETKKYAEITKLNVSIGTYEDQIKECKLVIGGLVYEKGLPLDEDPAIFENLTKMKELMDKIDEIKDQIMAIKNVNNCPNCGTEVARGEKFCGKCGTAMMTVEQVINDAKPAAVCPECGKELAADAVFCAECGTKVQE